jgi:hypothetical protein
MMRFSGVQEFGSSGVREFRSSWYAIPARRLIVLELELG